MKSKRGWVTGLNLDNEGIIGKKHRFSSWVLGIVLVINNFEIKKGFRISSKSFILLWRERSAAGGNSRPSRLKYGTF